MSLTPLQSEKASRTASQRISNRDMSDRSREARNYFSVDPDGDYERENNDDDDDNDYVNEYDGASAATATAAADELESGAERRGNDNVDDEDADGEREVNEEKMACLLTRVEFRREIMVPSHHTLSLHFDKVTV